MDNGDLATWSGAAAATITSVVALILALRSNRYSKDSAASALVSANAAIRSADAAERQAAAAEAALLPGQQASTPDAVTLRRNYIRSGLHDSTYQLRNDGPSDATNVRIDHPSWVYWQVDGALTAFPDGITIASGDAMTYTEAKTFGLSDLTVTTMWLTCDQMPGRWPIPIG